jgi:hypothetical protein
VEAGAAAVIVVNTEDSLLSPGDNQGGRRERVRREGVKRGRAGGVVPPLAGSSQGGRREKG